MDPIELHPGMDEVSLALTADAWSRTYRSRAVTVAASSVTTANGIRVLPDRDAAGPDTHRLPVPADKAPAAVLDATLDAMAGRYGAPTAHVVAMQLEYPRPAPRE